MKPNGTRSRTPPRASWITDPEALLAALANAQSPREASPPPAPIRVYEAPAARSSGWDDDRPEPTPFSPPVLRGRERWARAVERSPEVVVIRRRRAA